MDAQRLSLENVAVVVPQSEVDVYWAATLGQADSTPWISAYKVSTGRGTRFGVRTCLFAACELRQQQLTCLQSDEVFRRPCVVPPAD